MDNQNMNSQELQDLAALKQLHKGKGVAATVCGIISLIGCLGPISFICGIVAIIVGAVARKKSRKTTGTAGMVMGIIGVIISIVATICVVAVMAGIMVPQMNNYIDKTEVSSDMQLCDTVRTAIMTAMYDPSCQDDESLEFLATYSDGYYYDVYAFYKEDCAFTMSFREALGNISYEELCDAISSDGGYGIEFCIDGYNVSARISGTDIEVY